jgi:hypothetical protein
MVLTPFCEMGLSAPVVPVGAAGDVVVDAFESLDDPLQAAMNVAPRTSAEQAAAIRAIEIDECFTRAPEMTKGCTDPVFVASTQPRPCEADRNGDLGWTPRGQQVQVR